MSERYSEEVGRMIRALLTTRMRAHEVVHALGPRMALLAESALAHGDAMEEVAERYVGVDRLLRTMIKLEQVVDRPEHAADPAWGPAGVFRVLSGLREYIFHQCGDDGRPRLDIRHVLESLQRLDAGDSAKILVTGPERHSALVADFATLATWLQEAYEDVSSREPAPIGPFARTGPVPPIPGAPGAGAAPALGLRSAGQVGMGIASEKALLMARASGIPLHGTTELPTTPMVVPGVTHQHPIPPQQFAPSVSAPMFTPSAPSFEPSAAPFEPKPRPKFEAKVTAPAFVPK